MNETVTRAGAKTSEFWLILAFFGVVLLNGTDYVAIDGDHLAMLAGLAGGNLFGRTWLKQRVASVFGQTLPAQDPAPPSNR